MRGFEENVVVDEGFDKHTGIHTTLSFEGDDIVSRKAWDAEPLLRYAEHARQSTAGQRWGEGKLVGTIPLVDYYAKIVPIKDHAERQKAIRDYLQANSGFVMFDKYLKA